MFSALAAMPPMAMASSVRSPSQPGSGWMNAAVRLASLGATSVAEPKNQFYGYRSACVRDVGGNRWTMCAVVEQLTQDEILRRMKDIK